MEIDELKKIWQQYDLILNKLEKINKKLVLKTLSKKPKRKLIWILSKTIYALIITPLVFIIVIPGLFKIGNIDWQMIVGSILSISVLIMFMYFYFKDFIALIGIKVNEDSIVESARKVYQYKSIINRRQKYFWISFPILFAGAVLIYRKTLNFDIEGLLFMTASLVFLSIIVFIKIKYQQKEIKDLEKDIIELKEYLQ